MRILHCSDLHFCRPLDLRALRSKRWAGWLNWVVRRQWAHRPERWQAFLKAAFQHPPEVVAVTGDLAQLGAPAELEAASVGLHALAKSGVRVLYVPGNHDAYVNDPQAAQMVAALLKEFGGDEPIDEGGEPLAGGVRIARVGPVEFVLLLQAKPRGWLSANGRIKPAQWITLHHLAARPPRGAANDEPPVRIVLGHYPVCLADGRELPALRGLEEADRLRKLLESFRARLYLAGHVHTPYTCALATRCDLLCAGSLTAKGSYYEITVGAGEVYWEEKFVRP
ncbi:MAG: metallophosphoesterase [Planctomycetota bacterium]